MKTILLASKYTGGFLQSTLLVELTVRPFLLPNSSPKPFSPFPNNFHVF